MEDKLNELERKQDSYNREINQCYSHIAEIEREYNTLKEFKQKVIRSQGDYGGGNSRKSLALNKARSVSHDCNAAKIYCAEMTSVLNGVGAKLVNVIFERLKDKINNQLSAYSREILECEDRISEYNARLDDARQEYEAVKHWQESEAKG